MTARILTLPLACLLAGAATLGGCQVAPPGGGLRYAPDAATLEGWESPSGRLLCTAMGDVEVQVDLSGDKAPILVVVVNGSAAAVGIGIGVQATSVHGPIGEVLQRPLRATDPVDGSADYHPFAAMEPVAVERDHRAWFHLDRPTGRPATVGEYLVLAIEARFGDGRVERRAAPLVVRRREGPSLRSR